MDAIHKRDAILSRIKREMENRGIRQIDLAEELGQNKLTVSNRLNGKSEIKLIELIELCEFLGITITI